MTSIERLAGISDGLGRKAPVRVATTSNITLSGLQTIDGVALAEGDRVLVKSQTDTTENGIYDAASSTWTRSKDFDGSRDVLTGTSVMISSGSTALTEWVLTTTGTVTFDTSAITFSQVTIPAVFSGDVDVETTVASATTCDIGSAATMKVLVSGATTITSFGTAHNKLRYVRFSTALTLTHNGTTLILPGAANITTAAGDTAYFVSDSTGNWRCYGYQKATGAQVVSGQLDAEATVVSATTCDIGAAASERVLVSGTTTITSLGTKANKVRMVRFSGILTLTYNASSLILPSAASITTAAGDTAIFASDGSGNWRCYSYIRANGTSLVAAAIASDTITLAMVRAETNGGISAAAKTMLGNQYLPNIYQGCNAGSYDSHRLYFNPGVFSGASGVGVYHYDLPIIVDVNTVGINAAGSPPDASYSTIIGGMAEGAPVSPAALCFYACTRNTDNAVAILASTYTDYTSVSAYVPAGWTLQRKMHFEVCYVTGRGTNWNGIPNFFQDVDNSWTKLTGAGDDSNYQILSAGSATSYTLVTAATFVGDASRTVNLWCHVTATGVAGTAYLRPPGTGNGFAIGTVGATGDFYCFVPRYKLDSSRNIEYKITGGARLSVFIFDYSYDDPS
jgi:uncharacterized cupin superfamily protein